MSRHLRTRAAGYLGAIAICASLTAPTYAVAAGQPMQMGPLYAEPPRPKEAPPLVTTNGCAVQIVELIDQRREPETVGTLGGFNTMQLPADRQTWLRSVLQVGLAARGFNPSFSPDPAPPGAITMKVRFRTLWISLLAMNKVGAAAIQVAAGPAGSEGGRFKVYRGDKTSINMWGTQGEFNRHLNDVVAEALDQIADDLRPMCAQPPAPTETPASQVTPPGQS